VPRCNKQNSEWREVTGVSGVEIVGELVRGLLLFSRELLLLNLIVEAEDSSGTQRKGTYAIDIRYKATANVDPKRLRVVKCGKELYKCAVNSINH
jgi:hypothetical protein